MAGTQRSSLFRDNYGIYLAHPQARHFNLGRSGRDQVADDARREGMSVAEVERWQAPDPAARSAA